MTATLRAVRDKRLNVISNRSECLLFGLTVNLVSTLIFYFPLFELEGFQGKVHHLETDFS
jgi:hypothetical protein